MILLYECKHRDTMPKTLDLCFKLPNLCSVKISIVKFGLLPFTVMTVSKKHETFKTGFGVCTNVLQYF